MANPSLPEGFASAARTSKSSGHILGGATSESTPGHAWTAVASHDNDVGVKAFEMQRVASPLGQQESAVEITGATSGAQHAQRGAPADAAKVISIWANARITRARRI